MTAIPNRSAGAFGVIATLSLVLLMLGARPTNAQETAQVKPNQILRLLDGGEAVFGVFSGEKTIEMGARIVDHRGADFIFYSLESGPFDIPTMEAYINVMVEAAGDRAQPLVLRIPPIRDGRELASDRVREGLVPGVAGIVFPHVETADEARFAVESMGSGPGGSEADLVNILLIEDRVGVQNARDIVGTPGVDVVIPGPGDLGRAYEGDAEAIEGAIQTVLAACKEFDVPCGITAGADDIAERLGQGFRFIIATTTDDFILGLGRAVAGR